MPWTLYRTAKQLDRGVGYTQVRKPLIIIVPVTVTHLDDEAGIKRSGPWMALPFP